MHRAAFMMMPPSIQVSGIAGSSSYCYPPYGNGKHNEPLSAATEGFKTNTPGKFPTGAGSVSGAVAVRRSFKTSQVAIGIPSIKATLSDREYALITSVAGANFGEPLRLPPAALWLEERYAAAQGEARAPDQADNEQSGSIPVGTAPACIAAHCCECVLGQTSAPSILFHATDQD